MTDGPVAVPGLERAWRHLSDHHGPAEIGLLRDMRSGLEAIAVADDLAPGPALAGVRLAPDVTVAEIAALARRTSYRHALAGLPHGGGAIGLVGAPTFLPADRERLVRALARALRNHAHLIPIPDVGTDAADMARIHDEIGRAAGLPPIMGGIELGEVEAVGFGVASAAEVTAEIVGLPVVGARVVVHGFGTVGRAVARHLADLGMTVIAVSDTTAALLDPDGLDLARILAHKERGHALSEFHGATPIPPEDLVAIECEFWVPAGRHTHIDVAEAAELRTRVFLEAANLAATDKAEATLEERDIAVIPDVVANAGAAIAAAVELRGGDAAEVLFLIEERIGANVRHVLTARSSGETARAVAEKAARRLLDEAATFRRV